MEDRRGDLWGFEHVLENLDVRMISWGFSAHNRPAIALLSKSVNLSFGRDIAVFEQREIQLCIITNRPEHCGVRQYLIRGQTRSPGKAPS